MASTKRQRELARQRLERQAESRRRQAARRRRNQRLAVAGTVVGILVIIGAVVGIKAATSGKKSPPAAAPTPSTSAASASAAPGSCTYPKSKEPAARNVGVPPTTPATGAATMDIRFGQGDVVAELDTARAPCTVNAFEYLASKQYFDSTPCHRLVASAGLSVLQCGDPTGTGMGGPGFTFPDEGLTGATYPAGTVAMANAGPNTNGSQFFLVYKDSQLPPSYIPFGHITRGLDVVQKIAAGGIAPGTSGPTDGKPKVDATIRTLRVTTTPASGSASRAPGTAPAPGTSATGSVRPTSTAPPAGGASPVPQGSAAPTG